MKYKIVILSIVILSGLVHTKLFAQNAIFGYQKTSGEPVTDIDGNEYTTVAVGAQLWMAENLRVTRYADETPIPKVKDSEEWYLSPLADKAYCWYDNDSDAHASTYGALYNWAAAMNGDTSSDNNPSEVQGACPTSWHLPSDSEWKQLEIYLGMTELQVNTTGWRGDPLGGKLKETGTTHWNSPNDGATNETGFTALPGGGRYQGEFSYMGNEGCFWSSTEEDTANTFYRRLREQHAAVYRSSPDKKHGLSIRCLRDLPVKINDAEKQETGNLIVFPNPVNDELVINYYSSERCIIQIEIFNIQGKQIYQQREKSRKGVNLEVINIDLLPDGLYLYRLNSGKITATGKFIKKLSQSNKKKLSNLWFNYVYLNRICLC